MPHSTSRKNLREIEIVEAILKNIHKILAQKTYQIDCQPSSLHLIKMHINVNSITGGKSLFKVHIMLTTVYFPYINNLFILKTFFIGAPLPDVWLRPCRFKEEEKLF